MKLLDFFMRSRFSVFEVFVSMLIVFNTIRGSWWWLLALLPVAAAGAIYRAATGLNEWGELS